jgi:hypothetical protein
MTIKGKNSVALGAGLHGNTRKVAAVGVCKYDLWQCTSQNLSILCAAYTIQGECRLL